MRIQINKHIVTSLYMLQLATVITPRPPQPPHPQPKNDRKLKSVIEIEVKLNRNLRQQCIYYKPFSFKYNATINGVHYHMQSSSACIIKAHVPTIPEAVFMMNVRLVNYHLNNKGEAINHNGGDKIMTLNKILYLNRWFDVCGEYWVPMLPRNVKYNGIEDVRIMALNESNSIHYIGSYAMADKIGIVSGVTTADAPTYQPLWITPTFKTDNNWEKNWVFYSPPSAINTECRSPYIIYKWSPLYICQINNGENTLDLIKSVDTMPTIFEQFRGSTNGVNYSGRIWFITHFHHFVGSVRKYLHCFVVFNESMELLGYSNPFNFGDKVVEYCIGMIENNGNFIITFSTLDKTTELMVIPINYVARFIFGA